MSFDKYNVVNGINGRENQKNKLETVEREARWKWKSDDKESISRKIKYETHIPTKSSTITEVNILETWASELKTIIPGNEEDSEIS